MRRVLRRIAVIIIIAAATGCAITPRPTASFDDLVSNNDVVAGRQQTESLALINELAEKGKLFHDRDAAIVIDQILEKLFTDRERQHLRVHFARLPGENAFALPTGDIILHLDMLAALENEDQLAFVLAHEASHVIDNHAWKDAKKRQSSRFASQLARFLLLGNRRAGQYFTESAQRFSREQEFQADQKAAERLARAGFSLARAARFFDVLQRYPLAIPGEQEVLTHPGNTERGRRLLTMASRSVGSDKWNANPSDSYYAVREPWLLMSIENKLQVNDFAGALVQLAVIEKSGSDEIRTECLRGRIYSALGQNKHQSSLAMQELQRVADHAVYESRGSTSNDVLSTSLISAAQIFFLGQAETIFKNLSAKNNSVSTQTHPVFAVSCASSGLDNIEKYRSQVSSASATFGF